MALTPTSHKVAQSVSGTVFGAFTDGTYTFQAVVLRPATYTNLTGSSSGEFAGSTVLHRITINQTTSGTIAVTENSTAVASFATGTPPGTYEYGCATVGDIVITCSSTEDITVIWS